MAQETDKNQAGQEAGRAPEGVDPNREFDDAVTTEIPDVLARLMDGDQSVDLSDVHITDIQLTAHVHPAADDAFAAGFLLNDRFEIVELVHSGGMAQIYKAIDHRRHPGGSGQVHVAIKMMRPSVASDEEARLTLEREAAKAQTLSHPNIINIFDFDDHEGQFFLVMEWLEGESINDLLRRTSGQKLARSFAWSAIEGAAAAVQYAHQNHVVHADINPSNIFVTLTKDIKLLDFGVARYTDNPEHAEEDRPTWATQTYASPEVLSGLPPTFEDDVFSLACVAYRLLSGNHPFGGVPSLVAKHKGISVEPIPGLPRNDWQILRKALSYERSERPRSVSEFINRHASAGQRVSRLPGRIPPLLKSPIAAIAALAIVAAGLWLVLRDDGGEIVPSSEPVVVEETAATGVESAPALSPAEALISAATQALGDGQLVTPDENSARALFREALVLEPDNADALRGLRAVSDDFLEQARSALASDDPLSAYAAVGVAFETDPSNPAVDVVDQLLAAKGNKELADARLAVATGELDLAATQLSRAEQYAHVEPGAIQSLRREIEQRRQDEQLLTALAAADAHLSAGRLTEPDGENAHALLLELQGQHGGDERLVATTERLGERLLTRAAFAAAASEASEASALLDAVDQLGVLALEVEAARASLATTAASAGTDLTTTAPLEEQRGGDLQATAAGIEPGDVEPVVADPDEIPQAVTASIVPEPDSEPANLQESPLRVADAPVLRRRTVQEFGIERYVAPVFPRRARQRGITGTVDVGFIIRPDGSTDVIHVIESEPNDIFDDSVIKAVRQWRFETREEEVRARITLRFDMAP